MNSLLAFVTVVSLSITPLAFAEDAHHPENSQEKKVTAGKTVTAQSKTAQADQSMPMMQEQMQKMRELMDKI